MDPSVKHVWMLAAARPISRFAQDCISLLLPPFPIHFCLLLVEVNEPGVFRIAKYYGGVLFFHFRFLSFPLACCSYASLFHAGGAYDGGWPIWRVAIDQKTNPRISSRLLSLLQEK